MKDELEKVFITRDEDDDKIYVWRKPSKGVWEPEKIKGGDSITFHRSDRGLDGMDIYLESEFKTKFGITIPEKTIKNIQLSKKLLDNDDYKLISNNPNRKK